MARGPPGGNDGHDCMIVAAVLYITSDIIVVPCFG